MNSLITGPNLEQGLEEAKALTSGTRVLPNGKKGLRKMIPAPILSKGAATIRALEEKLNLRFEPVPTYLFYVEISGLVVALFTGASGISMSREVETLREGGKNDHIYTFPGPARYSNITLTRGLTMSRELLNWFLEGQYDFNVKRLNMTIYQGAPGMNVAGRITDLGGKSGYGIVKNWNIANAFPVRWQLSDLNVNDPESISFETVELAHEGIHLSVLSGTPMNPTGSLIGL